jgi:ADP-heptose:LPS heptosyltransferase
VNGNPALLRVVRALMLATDPVVRVLSPRSIGGAARAALVRLDTLGDFLLWAEAGREASRRLAPARVTLIANAAWAGYAERLGGWHEVMAVEIPRFSSDFRYRLRTLRRIAAAGFGVAVNPTFSRDLLTDDAVVRATGASERVGWVADPSNLRPWQARISDRWYTRLVDPVDRATDEFARNEEFVKKAFGAAMQVRLPLLPAGPPLPPALAPQAQYFVVAPGAAWKGKRWPAQRFARVTHELVAATGWRAVLAGTAAEAGVCAEVSAAVRALAGAECIDLAGRTSLAQLVELIRGAKLVVANDSAPVHIAAALGRPSVCVLGGGHYGRFAPYPERPVAAAAPACVSVRMDCFGCNWHCIIPHDPRGPVPCVLAVEESAVLDAARTISARSPA